MNSITRTIIGCVVALIVLGGLWYFYRDSFHFGIFGGPLSCHTELQTAETTVLTAFEQRAHDVISGQADGSEPITKSEVKQDITSFKDFNLSIDTITKLLNTDNIVEIAISDLRKKIADDQTADPASLVNKEKGVINGIFVKADALCDKLPSLSKGQNVTHL